ncbi:succinate dehydrogenase cytochrome b subunit [Luteolibacter ambystomatis]|uniref:Succinate dehydrogenase cytochrome b subunit n=1 Tax=Luteolibacter ambystomatis TaxID=2824561 RepID=A0A975PGT2_9BACT|nr:succinate dehydrogenase cytochrome b subunit [Luteolibacter ambystomatis]QUE52617.1 succinate dehydrogenase cytochrome b subunit [Luteolibacter ambystomatis]
MNVLSRSLCSFWSSSIGKKLIVAITGLVLVLFLAGHLAGNLVVFLGRGPFNDYAQFLHHFLHGAGVWIARIGLLVCLVLHVWATILLTKENKAAREPYAYEATVQASKSSRIMIWSGLTILAFVVYHLMHFTAHIGNSYGTYVDADYLAKHGEVRMDAWKMVIDGFSVWYVVLFYLIAMTMLCSHLSHGVASIFQTLGLRSRKSKGLICAISKGYAALIWFGFISIPLAILIFRFGR